MLLLQSVAAPVWLFAGEPAATPAPAAKAAEPSPSDAPASAAPKPQPRAALPAFEYTRLGHPEIAEKLQLTDQQRAEVTKILTERANQLASVPAAQRRAVMRAIDAKLAGLLTDAQIQKLTALAAEQKLRFNFRDQKWADVLDWFAQQAGLSLVISQAPSGTFTYSDDREFSPTEAIDLLNRILLTKGLTLVRNNRMLVLVDLSKDLPLSMIPRVAVEEIPQHGSFEVISSVFPLGRRPADAVVKEIQPLLGNYGKCIALPQTKQILVTETAGRLQAISTLIASIPEPVIPKKPEKPKPKETPKPPPTVLKIYAADQIDPDAAVAALTQLFGAAKFTIDKKVDQIMAYAPEPQQAAIKAAIDQMTANRPPEQRPRLEIYPLVGIDPSQFERQPDSGTVPEVQARAERDRSRKSRARGYLFLGLRQQLQAMVPNAQITVDFNNQRLLVFAEPKDQDIVKGALEKFGADFSNSTPQQVVVYKPTHATPESVADLITRFMPGARVTIDSQVRGVVVGASADQHTIIKGLVDQLDQQVPADQPQLAVYTSERRFAPSLLKSLQRFVPDAEVSMSVDSLRLVVIARPNEQAAVKTLVEQWKQIKAAEPDLELAVYALDKPFETQLLTLLQKEVPDARITNARDPRRLVVIATAADQATVKKWLDQWQQVVAQEKEPELKAYALDKPLDPQLLSTLQRLVPEAKISATRDSRQMIVIATTADQEVVKKWLDQWQQVVAGEEETELRLYPLKRPLAASLLSTLKTMAKGATITTTTDGKKLMVVALPTDHAIISKTLEQIENTEDLAGQKTLETYQVNGISAAELQRLLQPLVVASSITLDTPQDRLIVWGPPDEQAEFAKVVAKLEADPLAGTKPEMRFYALPSEAVSKSIITALTTLAPQAKPTWDADGERLMVIATPRDHVTVKQTIDEITTGIAPVEPMLKIYSLGPAERERFDALEADLTQRFAGMRVLKSPQSNELAIWAKPKQHEDLTQLMEQLKTGTPAAGRSLIIAYPLEHATPRIVFDMLQQLYPTARFTLDEKGSRIVVLAPLAQQGEIKMSIAQLDVESSPDNEEELRAYSMGDVDPTPLMTILESLAPDMRITYDRKARKLIAWGFARDHEKLKRTLEQFRTGEPEDRPVIKAYAVGGRSAVELRQLVNVLAQVAPEATLAIDAQGHSIVASARPEDHQRLQEAIDQVVKMDEMSAQRLEVYTLKLMTPAQATGMVRGIAPGAYAAPARDPKQIVVWTSAENHRRIADTLAKLQQRGGNGIQRLLRVHPVKQAIAEQLTAVVASTLPELLVISGQGTDQLMVWGTEEDHQKLDDVIKQLEKETGADQPQQMVVYDLGDVTPTDAQEVIAASIGTVQYVTGNKPDELIIRCDEKKHEQVKKLLDELKQVAAKPEETVKVYEFTDEEDANSVYQALSENDQKDLTIQVNTKTNSMIVRGPTKRQEELSKVIEQLRKQLPKAEKPEARIYRLKRADASDLGRVLRYLVPRAVIAIDYRSNQLAVTATPKDHVKIQDVVDQADSEDGLELQTVIYRLKYTSPYAIRSAVQPLIPNASIGFDNSGRMLIITASAEDHKRIKSIIDQADQPDDAGMTTKVYRLKYANPMTLRSALMPVMKDARIGYDYTSKSLVITASEEDHTRIKAVMDEADRPADEGLSTEVYKLTTANPLTLYTMLRRLLPNATLSYSPTAKTVIATASAEDHVRIKAVVAKMDRQGEGELVTQVYALKYVSPTTIYQTVQKMMPDVLATPDVTKQQLLVTAFEEEHKRIKAMIEQADKQVDTGLITEVYTLRIANPMTLYTALRPLIPNAKVGYDTTSKSLIITATKEEHAVVKPIIDKADHANEGDVTTQVYDLKNANPTYLSLALKTVVPTAQVTADAVNKKLIVTATDEDHTRIKEVVDKADVPADADMVTEVYKLNAANPVTLSTALRPLVPKALVGYDMTARTLVVTASPEDQQRVKAVVEKADGQGEGELKTEVYDLKNANPTYLSLALKTVVPTAQVTPDAVNKKLIVTATDEDHTRIKTVVDKADVPADADMVTEVYKLNAANPVTLSTALRPLVPKALVGYDMTARTLVVTASPEDQQRVKAVVEKADGQGEGELKTEVYDLKNANPTYLSLALKTVVPTAQVTADAVNKKLIVTATDEDHTRIKAVVDKADVPADADMVTEVYQLNIANPITLAAAIRPLVPKALVGYDTLAKTLVVTARTEDQVRIKAVVEKADGQGDGELTTQVYDLKHANPTYLSRALSTVVPTAQVTADAVNKKVIVTATQKDQLRIKDVVEQADVPAGADMVTEVYPLKVANPATLALAIRPLVPNARVGYDTLGKTLVATASKEDQVRIKDVVEKADRRGEGEYVTRVYSFKLADPRSAMLALKSLLPGATLSADASTNSLIVTASETDHKEIQPIVDSLDVEDPNASVLRTYQVKNADPQDVYDGLRSLYRYDRTISVGYQEKTGTILVSAPPADQEHVGKAITDIDEATAGHEKATLEVYELTGLDGDAAVRTLRALLVDELPSVELEFDMDNNQVLAIAEPRQHEMIRKALQQLTPVERVMEVFTLQMVDPESARSAINSLFSDLPFTSSPTVDVDSGTQQLFVKATKPQVEQIKKLLEKMGEGPEGSPTRRTGDVLRVVPYSGDIDEALQNIMRIWPQLHGNEIKVVPAEPTEQKSGNQSPPKSQDTEKDTKPKSSGNAGTPPRVSGTHPVLDGPMWLVSAPPQQPPGGSATPTPTTNQGAASNSTPSDLKAAKPPVVSGRADAPPSPAPTGSDAKNATAEALPPLVIIPSEGRLTIACRDPKVLDEFENLLKMFQKRRLVKDAGNYSIYMLRNAAAQEVAATLTSLFRERYSRSSSSSYSRYSRSRSSQRVSVVADDRMNAILVYGPPVDRAVVADLLEVLDSVDPPEIFSTEQPRLIPVENLPAQKVLSILQSVYKTHLSMRRGFKPLTIPRNIAPEMVSLLEQVNAAASMPVLTLDLDETTNSIVIRAPAPLGKEIEQFVRDLDEQAQSGGTQSIGLVVLKKMNSRQADTALRMLMGRGSSRSSSSRYTPSSSRSRTYRRP